MEKGGWAAFGALIRSCGRNDCHQPGNQEKNATGANWLCVQSLSTLSKCIAALTEKGRTHVPFRESKLTHMLQVCDPFVSVHSTGWLQDALGGNSGITVIATLSATAAAAEESFSTVSFGLRVSTLGLGLRGGAELRAHRPRRCLRTPLSIKYSREQRWGERWLPR